MLEIEEQVFIVLNVYVRFTYERAIENTNVI